MTRIKPDIKPTSLTEHFNLMFSKYLTPINETYTGQAFEDIQDDYAKELEELLNDYSEYLTVDYDEDEEGNVYAVVDHDDFVEKVVFAITEQFRLEKR